MGAMIRQQMYTLAKTDEEDPEWFTQVCAEIANGKSVDEAYALLLENYDVTWGAFRTWVKVNPEREQKYQDALSARLELRRELAAKNVTDIATVAHAEVKPSDTLRAAEMVLGSGGSSGISVGVGSGPGRVKIEVEFVGAGCG